MSRGKRPAAPNGASVPPTLAGKVDLAAEIEELRSGLPRRLESLTFDLQFVAKMVPQHDRAERDLKVAAS